MRRRTFIAALGGAAAWPLVARAQQKVFRIGVLSAGRVPEANLAAFSEGFRELGWVEGKNFVYQFRFADNRPDRLAGTSVPNSPSKTLI